MNNPARFRDPSGHKACEDSEGLGSCLSEKQADKKWEKDRAKRELGRQDETNILRLMNGGQVIADADVFISSPFACKWIDCVLSVVGVLATAGTMVGLPEISVPAFLIDVGVTLWAVTRTETDFRAGEITNVNRIALNATAGLGLIPSSFGLGLSILNMAITFSGYPR
jgi:hypothetical protein